MSRPTSIGMISRLNAGTGSNQSNAPVTTSSATPLASTLSTTSSTHPMNSKAVKSRTQSLKPSTKSSAKSSANDKPKSFLTADALQTNLKFKQFLTRVQYMLIDGSSVGQPLNPSIMSRAALVLRPVDYAEIVSERAAGGDCGWPPCSNRLIDQSDNYSNSQRGRFKLDIRGHRVIEAARPMFCSSQCAIASDDYQVNLKEEPMYLRNFDAAAAHINRPVTNQPTHIQSSTNIAVVSPTVHASSNQPSPQSSSPALMSEESSLPITERTSSVSTDFTSALTSASDKPSQHQSHNPSVKQPVTLSSSQSQKKAVTFKSESTADEVDVDELMAVALREKAKIQSALNPVHALARDIAASDDDDDELQSEAETRANYASLVPPQSPFAQLLRLAVHVRSEWTDMWCARLALPPLLSVPSVDESERSRQNVLLSLVHQYAEPICETLGIGRCWRSIVSDLDSMALTFVVSESVPKLTDAQWKLLVLAMIHAVTERRNPNLDEVTWLWDGARAATIIKQLDWSADQANAIRGAVGPVDGAIDMFHVPKSGVSALPAEILPTIFSFLDYDSLTAASIMSRSWQQASHNLIDIAYDALMHNKAVAHAELKLKQVGYVEGLDLGRERLMQQGFDEGFPIGMKKGWSSGFEKGLLAAIALVTHSSRPTDAVFTEVERVCADVNANVMHLPNASSSNIRLESDIAALPRDQLCDAALKKLNVDPGLVKPRFHGHDEVETDADRLVRINQQIDQLVNHEHSTILFSSVH